MMKRIVLSVCAAVVAAVAAWGETYTWVGGTDNSFFTAANWQVSEAAATAAPGELDDVIIPAGDANFSVTAEQSFKVKSLVIGSADGSASGTATLTSKTASEHEIVGNLIVYTKGNLSHEAYADNNPAWKANFKVGGNMTLNGTIDVTGKGYEDSNGPGAGSQHALHGDKYGDVRLPDTWGSGAIWGNAQSRDRPGGGIVRLDVVGELALNGSISAKGIKPSSVCASGGSVLIKAGTITGSGTINVTAPAASAGHVAIYQRTTDDWGFTGTISIGGGDYGGGTYYRETPAMGGEGELTIGSGKAACDLTGQTGWTEPFSKLINNSSNLKLTKGALTLTRGLEGSGCGTLSELILAPPAGTVFESKLESGATLTANSLVCQAPGATLAFLPSAGTLAVADNGQILLCGSADESLTLRSLTAGSRWNLALGANVETAEANVHHLVVSDGRGVGGTISAYFSANDGNNENWAFPGVVVPGETITWTGASDGAFGNAGNWDLGRQVCDTDVIFLPAGCPRYPTVTATMTNNSIIAEAGASLTLHEANLFVTNSIDFSGEIHCVTQSLYYLASEAPQWMAFSGDCENVKLVRSADGVHFTDGFTADIFRFVASGPISISFAADKLVKILKFLQLEGPTGGAGSGLTLTSAVAGQRWRLDMEGNYVICGAGVKDSLAAPTAICVGGLCTDLENNENWDFGETAAYRWIGGAAGAAKDFRTPANWRPVGVPASDSVVMIVPASGESTVEIQSGDAVAIDRLIVGGAGGAAKLTLKAKLTVGRSVSILSGGVCAFDYATEPIEVKGNFDILTGGTLTHSGPNSIAGNRINLKVGGDMLVDFGGAIDVKRMGYAGATSAGHEAGVDTSSHGGVGVGLSPASAYGSIFQPTTYGAGSAKDGWYSGSGGGAVQLDVAGTLTLNGGICADTGHVSNQAGAGTSSGGSVYVRAGTIAGTGAISASSISTTQTGVGGAGGRIALYQTKATDWSAYTGNVSALSNTSGGNGTIYRQVAGDKEHGGTITIAGQNRTPFPMPDDGNPKRAYKDAILVVDYSTASVGVPVNTNGFDVTKNEVWVKDLILKSNKSYLTLNGATIRVGDRTHEDGEGWGGTMETLIKGDGKVIWGFPGFLLFVR